jgi:hypothetical protein
MNLVEFFSIKGAEYKFRYHDKIRHVRIEKVDCSRAGEWYIVAENITIDGGVPDKVYSSYLFYKMSEIEMVGERISL